VLLYYLVRSVVKQVSVATIITLSCKETKLHDEFTFNSSRMAA